MCLYFLQTPLNNFQGNIDQYDGLNDDHHAHCSQTKYRTNIVMMMFEQMCGWEHLNR